jgi:uncharacterized protein YpmB
MGVMMIIFGIIVLIIVVVVGVLWYAYFGQYVTDYHKAKKEIIAFVQSHKKRCTGNNRFIVTVESLQNSFVEYDVKTIEKVWLELIRLRLIEEDPQDQVWCVR